MLLGCTVLYCPQGKRPLPPGPHAWAGISRLDYFSGLYSVHGFLTSVVLAPAAHEHAVQVVEWLLRFFFFLTNAQVSMLASHACSFARMPPCGPGCRCIYVIGVHLILLPCERRRQDASGGGVKMQAAKCGGVFTYVREMQYTSQVAAHHTMRHGKSSLLWISANIGITLGSVAAFDA